MPLLYAADIQDMFLTPPGCKSQMQGFDHLSVSSEERFRAHRCIKMLIKNMLKCDNDALHFNEGLRAIVKSCVLLYCLLILLLIIK